MAIEIRLPSGSRIPNIFKPVNLMEIGNPGMPGELIIHNGMLYIYGPNGETFIDGGYVQTDAILAKSITAEKLTIGTMQFLHNIVWTATNYNTAHWSSGTIMWSDGTTSSVDGGNTGSMSTTTYIYYDGSSTLATSTSATTAVGDTERLLAIVELGSVGSKCVITTVNSVGTTINGDRIVTGRIESADGKTYFDLTQNRLVISDDDSNARVVIGKR
jgi:hypothetical protein